MADPEADDLVALTGSDTRAAILELLYGDEPRAREESEIVAAAQRSRGAVRRALESLVASGLVRKGKASGLTNKLVPRDEGYGRPYSAVPSTLVYPELRAIVAKTRGAAAVIRGALPSTVRLAWITGKYALFRAHRSEEIALIVIGHPKRGLEKQLSSLSATLLRPVKPTVIYDDEWVARLDKRELTVRRLRCGPKLWLRGDGTELYLLERRIRERKELIKQAIATGSDLTDEWDDDWDPAAPNVWPRV